MNMYRTARSCEIKGIQNRFDQTIFGNVIVSQLQPVPVNIEHDRIACGGLTQERQFRSQATGCPGNQYCLVFQFLNQFYAGITALNKDMPLSAVCVLSWIIYFALNMAISP